MNRASADRAVWGRSAWRAVAAIMVVALAAKVVSDISRGMLRAGRHMERSRTTVSGIIAVLLVLASTVTATTRTPGRACAAGKTKVAGKHVYCEARCDFAAVRAGMSPSAICLDRCGAKRSLAWTKLEARGGCATTGDESAIGSADTALRADLDTALGLGGPSACTAGKHRAAGKRTYCGLKCNAKAMASGAPVAPACLQRCAGRLAVDWARAERPGDCLGVADRMALEERIDAFVSDVVAALPDVPTTSTTSTTTSTCTTTTLCSSCVLDTNGDGVRTWLMIGDSNTTWLSCAYPIVLQARYDPAVIEVVNAGLFGTTAGYWVAYDLLGARLVEYDPDAVLIALGTNDVPARTPSEVFADLRSLYDEARSWCDPNGRCAVAYVATIPPIYSPPYPIDLGADIDALNALIRASIPSPNVVDFDSWMPQTWDPAYMWNDGLHLSCYAHALRADVCDGILSRVADQ